MGGGAKGMAGKVCGVLIFTFCVVAIPAVCFDFYYDLNDDTVIKDILSGAYTGVPSGYSIQMLYPLSWLIASAYKVMPEMPWFGVFLCCCQFGVLMLAAWRLWGLAKTGIGKTAALVTEAVLALGLILRELVIIQYSITAGLCMIGAVFLFLTAKRADKPSAFLRRNMVPVLLVVLSFMIRTEICLMLMPFLLLAGMVKWGGEEKIFTGVNFRKYLITLGTALFGMLVVISLDYLAYSSSDWMSFRQFFDARTKLYDFYGLPEYYSDENNADTDIVEQTGLSEESYALLENYNFALDESIDSWVLDSLAAYQRQQAQNGQALHSTFGFVSKNSVSEALWLYKEHLLSGVSSLYNAFFHQGEESKQIFSGEAVCGYAVAGTYVVYILLCFFPVFVPTEETAPKHLKKGQALFKILALLVIRSILWLYLYMVDRIVSRVTMPLLMMELAVLLGFLLNDLPQGSLSLDNSVQQGMTRQEARSVWFFGTLTNMVISVLCILFLAGAFAVNFHTVSEEYTAREYVGGRWGALMEYCKSNKGNYYIIDVYSSTSYQGIPYAEKIFCEVDNTYRNYDICGGWVAKSPLYKKKLARSGLKDVQSALYSAKKNKNAAETFFIAACDKDLGWLEQYYFKRGLSVEAQCIDRIDDMEYNPAFSVYKLVYKQKKEV